MRLRWFAMACLSAASLMSANVLVPSALHGQETKIFDVPSLESSDSEASEVVTIAVAPLDKLLPNITHLMRVVGAGAQSGLVNQAVNGYTSGIDRARPIGLFVNLGEDGAPVVVASLPVSDLDAFLGGLELFGEPEDLGEDLYSMSIGPNTVFAQKEGDWLYISSSEEALEELPEGGVDSLKGMVAKNDLWVEVNVQNIPDDLVELITGQLRAGFEQAMEAQAANASDEELEATRAQGEQMMESFEEAMEGTEKFVVGLGIRPSDKTLTIDTGAKFVDGSRYAKQMQQYKTAKSKLSGGLTDGSAMLLKAFQIVSAEDVANMESSFSSSLENAYKLIDENADDKAMADRAKQYVEKLLKILVQSGKEGSLETVASITTTPSLNIFAGVSVADGSEVESLAKDLADELSKINAPVKLELKTGSHKGVTLHKLTAPIPGGSEAAAARKIFGENINVSIGTSPKAIYLSIGKTAEASLKTALDGVTANPSTAAETIKMRLSLSQFLSFVQSIEPNPVVDRILSSMSSGDDQIMIDNQLIERGGITRLTIQEGVLKAVAGGVQAGMAAQGGGF